MWQNTDDRSDAEYNEWLAEVGQHVQQEQQAHTPREIQDDPLFLMMVDLMRWPLQ